MNIDRKPKREMKILSELWNHGTKQKLNRNREPSGNYGHLVKNTLFLLSAENERMRNEKKKVEEKKHHANVRSPITDRLTNPVSARVKSNLSPIYTPFISTQTLKPQVAARPSPSYTEPSNSFVKSTVSLCEVGGADDGLSVAAVVVVKC